MFDSCEVPMTELRAIADIHELLDRRNWNDAFPGALRLPGLRFGEGARLL